MRLHKKKAFSSIVVQPSTGCGRAFRSFLVFETWVCMQIEDSLSVHGRVQHIVASMPLLQSLCWTCRLKSLTLFSPLTAKAATVSNTNSLLSSYICSGQGCKDGSRSKKDVGQSFCPSLYSNLCLVLDFLLTWEHRNVPCIMSNTEYVIVSRI